MIYPGWSWSSFLSLPPYTPLQLGCFSAIANVMLDLFDFFSSSAKISRHSRSPAFPLSQEYNPRSVASSCLMCDKMYAGQRSSVSQSRPNRSVMTGGGFEADYYTNYSWSWTHLHLHIITEPSSSNIYSHTKFIVLNAKRYHNQTKPYGNSFRLEMCKILTCANLVNYIKVKLYRSITKCKTLYHTLNGNHKMYPCVGFPR